MLMLMLASVLVLCRLTGQYVHPRPTRWDRAFNRPYCARSDREVCTYTCHTNATQMTRKSAPLPRARGPRV
jgi:hypothetical protein